MKAAVQRAFGAPLVVEDLVLDPPEPGEIHVRIAAVAVCHSDIHAGDGAWGGSLPAVNGHEASGIVVAVGEGVATPSPGDHVVVTLMRTCGECFHCDAGRSHLCAGDFALSERSRLRRSDGTPVAQGIGVGAFAEEVVVHASQVVVIEDTVPLDVASLLACGVITGYGAVVNTADVAPGESVVVIGTGGVGLNCIQGAVAAGADPLIAVDLSAQKLDAAKRFGATHTVDSSGTEPSAAVRKITDGRGADHVFVSVGSVAAIEQGLGLLRPGGTLIVVGMTPSGTGATFDMSMFAFGSYRVLGSRMGSTVIARDIPALVDRYRERDLLLDELITRRYALEQINDAIEAVRGGEALRNVIVFEGVGA